MALKLQMTGNKPGVRTFLRKAANRDIFRLGEYNFMYDLNYTIVRIRRNQPIEKMRTITQWCNQSFGFKNFIYVKHRNLFWFTSSKEKSIFLLAWSEIVDS